MNYQAINYGYALELANSVRQNILSGHTRKRSAIWLETTGCSGNLISFTNAERPGLMELLTGLVDLVYNNTLMSLQGELAYEQFLNTLDKDFILLIDGAVSTAQEGRCNIIANRNNQKITALEAVQMAGARATHVIAVGTCACYGGISAAEPNPSNSKSVDRILNREVIKVPGCPAHPEWVLGTIAHLIGYGPPSLDAQHRPLMFYGTTIHQICTRRGYFDKQQFATKPGDKECMFQIGCKGPITHTDCPVREWNNHVSWPVGINTPCIGCAHPDFPNGMEPFITQHKNSLQSPIESTERSSHEQENHH